MIPSYFTRSQKCTYAIETAKNAIVTAIQMTSCIISSALGLPLSVRNPHILFPRATLGLQMFKIHHHEFCSLARRIKLRPEHLHAWWRSIDRLLDQCPQYRQQERHRARTDQHQHRRLAYCMHFRSFSEVCPDWITRSVKDGSRLHKEFVKHVDCKGLLGVPARHARTRVLCQRELATPIRLAGLGEVRAGLARRG